MVDIYTGKNMPIDEETHDEINLISVIAMLASLNVISQGSNSQTQNLGIEFIKFIMFNKCYSNKFSTYVLLQESVPRPIDYKVSSMNIFCYSTYINMLTISS